MDDKHVRLTTKFEINEEMLKRHGLKTHDVFNSISFRDKDIIDGSERLKMKE